MVSQQTITLTDNRIYVFREVAVVSSLDPAKPFSQGGDSGSVVRKTGAELGGAGKKNGHYILVVSVVNLPWKQPGFPPLLIFVAACHQDQELLGSMLFGMANRSSGGLVRPSVITLKGGTVVTVVITGFNWQMSGSLTIHTLDPATNARGQIAGDEVINIQF